MKEMMDLIDHIQHKIEELSPFGTMVKMFYRVKGPTDTWFIPNRKEVEPGILKINNFMNFFFKKTLNGRPVMVKNVF